MRLVTAGANPVELRRGIVAASGFIIEDIKALAVPIDSIEVLVITLKPSNSNVVKSSHTVELDDIENG